MALEFSGAARARKESALEKIRPREGNIEHDLAGLKTFQHLIWYLQREELFQGYDPLKPDGHSGNIPELRNDAGEPVAIQDIIDDIHALEIEEGTGEPSEFFTAVRHIPSIFKKVMRLQATRAELNSIYAREWPTKLNERGGAFDVHAIPQEQVRTIPHSEQKPPIIIAPGYTVGYRAVRRNAMGLAELGRSVMTYTVPPDSKDFDATMNLQEDLPVYTKVHSTALLRTMEVGDKKIFETPQKYDVIGYSFGAISTLYAADANPEKFNSIVLINPAGLDHALDSHTLESLRPYIPGTIFEQLSEKIRYVLSFGALAVKSSHHKAQVFTQADRQSPGVVNAILSTPARAYKALVTLGELDTSIDKPGALFEEFSSEMNELGKEGGTKDALAIANAISWAELLPVIQRLTERGIKIRILPGEEDPLFNVDSIEQAAAKTDTPVHPIAGGHAHMGFYPGAIAELCIDSFNDMAEQSNLQTE